MSLEAGNPNQLYSISNWGEKKPNKIHHNFIGQWQQLLNKILIINLFYFRGSMETNTETGAG